LPAVGMTFVSVFGSSWDEARRLPPPAGPWPDEYGYAAFTRMSEWNRTEALFCRREGTARKVDDKHHTTWLPATVEILDVPPTVKDAGASLVPGAARTCNPSRLREKIYFDPTFLVLVLSDVLGKAADRDELPLAMAVDLTDKAMAANGLAPRGDFSYVERRPKGDIELTCRVYTGLPDTFGVIWATLGSFDLVLLSELGDGQWLVSGLADEIGTRMAHGGGERAAIYVQELDEPLRKIFAAHKRALAKKAPRPAPASFLEGVAAWNRFAEAAFD